MDKKEIFLLIVLATFFCSCGLHIEKRRYQKGFFIQHNKTFFLQKKTETCNNADYSFQSDSVLTNDSQIANNPQQPQIFEKTMNSNRERENSSLMESEKIPECHEDSDINKGGSKSKLWKLNERKAFSFNKPLKLNHSISIDYKKREANKNHNEASKFVMILGIVLLMLLGLVLLFILAISAAYGSPLWVLILLGLSVLSIIALIGLLFFKLYWM